MNSPVDTLSVVDRRCAEFLCELTALGENYTVLDSPAQLRGKRLPDYSLRELFERLALPGTPGHRPPAESLMEEVRCILEDTFGLRGLVISDATLLKDLFGEA